MKWKADFDSRVYAYAGPFILDVVPKSNTDQEYWVWTIRCALSEHVTASGTANTLKQACWYVEEQLQEIANEMLEAL